MSRIVPTDRVFRWPWLCENVLQYLVRYLDVIYMSAYSLLIPWYVIKIPIYKKSIRTEAETKRRSVSVQCGACASNALEFENMAVRRQMLNWSKTIDQLFSNGTILPLLLYLSFLHHYRIWDPPCCFTLSHQQGGALTFFFFFKFKRNSLRVWLCDVIAWRVPKPRSSPRKISRSQMRFCPESRKD